MNPYLRSMLYWIFTLITFPFMTLVDAIFYLIYSGSKKKVSRVEDPILLTPANEIAQKIRNREWKAEDVMSAFIIRAKEVNPLVNAVVGERYDLALREARNLDCTLDSMTPEQRNAEFSEEKKPFLGVPLSVKEAFYWKGMANTSGLTARRHIQASEDAPVLINLRNAGAIPFIQTNISEVCMWFESSNYVYGTTNNAYDVRRMVGGSSGGEGCIISTGASVFGVGSDIGGSIRMPCFFNGIFGHKPTGGIVENRGQYPIASEKAKDLLSTGPMCRYASDLIPMLKVMAGPEKVANLKLDVKVEISKLRVISVPDDSGSLMVSKVEKELVEIQRKVMEFFKKERAEVHEKRIRKFRYSLEFWTGRMNLADDGPKFANLMSGREAGHVNCFLELLKKFVCLSEHTLPAIALGLFDDVLPKLTVKNDLKAVEVLKVLKQELLAMMGDDGVLLYPSHPKLAPYHSHPIFTPFNFAYTGLFNALGFPVTQCPLGLSKDGRPLGVQVVTTPFNDHLSLAVARTLEKHFGGWANF
ncbi:fatty-acid amide hydrolase 2-like [Biomphalaria glabrata]|uniref:Fatty-acid amide hydrolase 2-like n=1 Tax=Biomphalaria glabrata TaxID=6526 RepID=A0A9U8E0Z2_BIOGL|nr:fatty-acid amide hydrolase 2-like [Biomphalaria glabrata]XP_013068649.2 fatty-acid amide hydrolase 2-like [Biomphalaria glabrata]